MHGLYYGFGNMGRLGIVDTDGTELIGGPGE